LFSGERHGLAVASDVIPHGAILPKAFSSMVTCFRARVPICSAKYVTGRSGCPGPEFVGAYWRLGLRTRCSFTVLLFPASEFL
jgi:hypothetical protein